MMKITRSHTISAGHRIPGHEDGAGKCARLHGHTYAFDVTLSSEVLDETGFVVDFGRVTAILNEWDHRTILWSGDPLLLADDLGGAGLVDEKYGVIRVPFVPTSENMAKGLVRRFMEEFQALTYAAIVVWESGQSSAEYFADRYSFEHERLLA